MTMTEDRLRVAAIVLAAGSSRRMGTNKLLLALEGEPLVRRAVRRCLAVYALFTKTEHSWATADPVLMAQAPAWRCDDLDFEDDVFAPLGS